MPDSVAATEPLVEVMGLGTEPDAWARSFLYDPQKDEYKCPEPAPEARESIKAWYLQYPGATAEKFAASWPQIQLLTEAVYPEEQNLLAILDTGVIQKHPMLAGCIRDSVDLTGEGLEDQFGHGTLAALIARMSMPGIPLRKLVIVKCVGGNGRGTQDELIAGLRWMQTYNQTHTSKIAVASLSLGVYNTRFTFLPCDGTCKLCSTAVDVAKDITLYVAAGNTAGKTACPARAAFLPSKPDIIAQARSDEATSGTGTAQQSFWAGATPRFLTLRRNSA